MRFFAGYGYTDTLTETHDAISEAYARGVPMGDEILGQADSAPEFLVWALHDPRETWRQRAQIVKGWMEGGESREQVFDVACSDRMVPDPVAHRYPDNGARNHSGAGLERGDPVRARRAGIKETPPSQNWNGYQIGGQNTRAAQTNNMRKSLFTGRSHQHDRRAVR